MSPLPVLMYHGFGRRSSDEDPQRLFLPLTTFERHVRMLTRLFRAVSLAEVLTALDGGPLPRRPVLVTIDDGYASTWEAAEILSRYGVPAVVFVPAALVGHTLSHGPGLPAEPVLTADRLRALPSLGMDVGCHAMEHVSLAGRSADELRHQVVAARDRLSEILGRPPTSFAYPFGDVDDAAAQAVRDAGFGVGFGVCEGGGRWALLRRGVSSRDTTTTVALKASATWDAARRAVPTAVRTAAGNVLFRTGAA